MTGGFSPAGDKTRRYRILSQCMPRPRRILRRLSEKIRLSVHFYRIKEKLKWFRFILSLI
ncbi:hypothetical protein [Klebsiella quasipneumoniae]|uniref:hypothetical protein n=1 Tax=Klebsiella quasipneumoniae TaxID=1463165 RepID=UPI001C53098D|nr:hypothetical protein [Klebsiella quasipneumoniae]